MSLSTIVQVALFWTIQVSAVLVFAVLNRYFSVGGIGGSLAGR